MQLSVWVQITIEDRDRPALSIKEDWGSMKITCFLPAFLSYQANLIVQKVWKQIDSTQVKEIHIKFQVQEELGERKEFIQHLSREAAEHIQKYQSITQLSFAGSFQECIIFPPFQLKEFPFLSILTLQSNQLTEQAMFQLSKIKFNNLEVLSLRKNPVRNRGIKYLSKICCPQLRQLRLGQNQFSWEGLKYLSKIMAPRMKVSISCEGKFDCGLLGVMVRSRMSSFCYSTQITWVSCQGHYVQTGPKMQQLRSIISRDISKEGEESKTMHLNIMSVLGLRNFNYRGFKNFDN